MRRAKHSGAKENMDRWLLTYADLITLLMIFFVVMFAMSKADQERVAKVAESLKGALGAGVLKGTTAPLPSALPSVSDGGAALAVMERDLGAIKQEVEAFAQKEGLSGFLTVRPSPEGIIVNISGNLLFDSGKATLKDSSVEFLDMMAGTFSEMPNQIQVVGHTDNIPIESDLYASNWELSVARATAVVRYLAAAGVNPERLSSVGYGEYRPLVDNDTREHRALNRRVEILIRY